MKKLDFVLIALYSIISVVIAYFLLWGPSEEPSIAQVKVNNKVVAQYPLPSKETIRLELDELGHNIVVIEGNEIYMEVSDCPDQLCVHQGRIHRTGSMIVCLPNKVVVEILGKNESTVDILSY